jgi:WD40 repeat protein
MSKIFISHSSANNAAALAVAQWLKENGWDDYFLDITPVRGLAPGERWQEALKRAADRCEGVLFLISPAWRDSRWCLAEFLLAKQIDKTIFGVLIEPTSLETLPKETTAEWQFCDLVAGAERQVFHVHSDPLVPQTDVSFGKAGLALLKIGLERSGLNPATFPWPPPNDRERAPYRGLKALEAEDAAVFFGREAAIVRGLDALRGIRERGLERMLVILGASGAGKSSFLRAGLWPRLKRDDRHFFPLSVIRPERATISGPTGLIASLETAFRERKVARSRADIRKTLDQPDGLDRIVTELQSLARRTLGFETEPPTIVIPIDQGEELFGADGRTEADTFLSLLGHTLGPPETEGAEAIAARKRTIAVVAIRSDSYERLQAEARIEPIKRTLFDLLPIAKAELKSLIEGPAKRATDAGCKLKVDHALTEQLLQDAEGADAVPLLAFILERLFTEYGGDGDLRLDEYQSLGGVRGSIETAVTAAFIEPERKPPVPTDNAEREGLLQQAFIPWLASVDLETEKPKRRVARWGEIPAAAHPLLERLIEVRLLIRDRQQLEGRSEESITVEIAHEALLRQWTTLTTWLDEDADTLKTAHAIRRTAGEWNKNSRAPAWLVHSGERLEAAEAVQKRQAFHQLLGQEGGDYLAACRAKEEAATAEREANLKRLAEQTSLVLATAAQAANDSGYYDRGLRLALLAAYESGFSPILPEGEAQLRRAVHSSALLARLAGHEDTLMAATFSPDGHRVVTASRDKTARIWDVTTGKQLMQLTGHLAYVRSAIFSSDGQRVVTASADQTARVWDATTGKELAMLYGHQAPVWVAVFSPDGQRVLTTSMDHTAWLWDVRTGQTLVRFTRHVEPIYSAAFSPDGQLVVTASPDGAPRVWDAMTGKELVQLVGHEKATYVVFSPNGERILTACSDQNARIWDVTTGKQLVQLTGHQGPVGSAIFSPDGQRVVTASDDKTARIWDVTTGQELFRLTGHEGGVGFAGFSSDDRHILTVSTDHSARVWNAKTGRELVRLVGHENSLWSAAFSPDGKRVVTASKDWTARVWNTTTGQEVSCFKGHDRGLCFAVFSPDWQHLLTWTEDDSIPRDKTPRLWDFATGKDLGHLRGHEARVTSAVFSPDGQRIVTTSEDHTARVWDATTAKELARLVGHEDVVRSARFFSSDGRLVSTSSSDATMRIWDSGTGKELSCFGGHGLLCAPSVHFSPDGQRVIIESHSRGMAQVVKLMDTTGHELARLEHATFCAFSLDGQRVLMALDDLDDHTVRVWDVNTGNELARLIGHEWPVSSATFGPDGQRIVTESSMDVTARVWDTASGKMLFTLRGHSYDASLVMNRFSPTFSPDGRCIMTASDDGTAWLWDATTGMKLAGIRGHEGSVSSATFSPDGQHVATNDNETVRVWDVRWLTQYGGKELVEAVSRETGVSVRILSQGDVATSPILRGREGEDVCASRPFIARSVSAAAFEIRRTKETDQK